ncbi:phosphoprotein [Mosqueiro virus]|uniref:Phosphoprotein n=1 Tax=Mosqueiro virus TaxID=200403 RepID=A0A0D3R1I8_9RHAB|nr:phosphoprotein [Mosqueiro virus]AJR28518.1 phosphoprotein [Mosqueiro virus]
MDRVKKLQSFGAGINWEGIDTSLSSSKDDDLEDDPTVFPEMEPQHSGDTDWADAVLNPKELPPSLEEKKRDDNFHQIGEIRLPNHLTASEELDLVNDIERFISQIGGNFVYEMRSYSKSKRVLAISEKLTGKCTPAKTIPIPPDPPGPKEIAEAQLKGPLFEVLKDLDDGLTVKKRSGGTAKLYASSLDADLDKLDVTRIYTDKKSAFKAILKCSPKRQFISSMFVFPY